jgi:hypothetical protein
MLHMGISSYPGGSSCGQVWSSASLEVLVNFFKKNTSVMEYMHPLQQIVAHAAHGPFIDKNFQFFFIAMVLNLFCCNKLLQPSSFQILFPVVPACD